MKEIFFFIFFVFILFSTNSKILDTQDLTRIVELNEQVLLTSNQKAHLLPTILKERMEVLKRIVRLEKGNLKDFILEKEDLQKLQGIVPFAKDLYEEAINEIGQLFVITANFPFSESDYEDQEEMRKRTAELEKHHYQVSFLGKTYEAHTFGDNSSSNSLEPFTSGKLMGVLLDDVFFVDKEQTIEANDEADARRKINFNGKFGKFTMLYILGEFSDTSRTKSRADILEVLTPIREWFKEVSYAEFEFVEFVVTKVYKLPKSQHHSDYTSEEYPYGYMKVSDELKELAKQDGYDYKDYDYWVASIDPYRSDTVWSNWAGRGFVGHPGVWINGYDDFRVLTHELGHNLGYWHSSSFDQDDLSPPAGSKQCSFGGKQTWNEYGDFFSPMGRHSFDEGHFNLYHKLLQNWINYDKEVIDYRFPSEASTTTSNTTQSVEGYHEIYAFDHPNARGKKLGIVYNHNENDIENYFYVVSHRQKGTSFPNGKAGSIDVHMVYNQYSSKNSTHILDTSLYSPWGLNVPYAINDAQLPLGNTWIDLCSIPSHSVSVLSRVCENPNDIYPTDSSVECPGPDCQESCKIQIYINQEKDTQPFEIDENSIFGNNKVELITLNTFWSSELKGIPKTKREISTYLIDFNNFNKPVSALAMGFNVYSSNKMYPLIQTEGNSPFMHYTSMKFGSTETFDIVFEVSDYVNGQFFKSGKFSTGLTSYSSFSCGEPTVSFSITSASSSTKDLGDLSVSISYPSSTPQGSYLYRNGFLVSKNLNSRSYSVSDQINPGYNKFIVSGSDGNYIRDFFKDSYEKFSVLLPFSLKLQRKSGSDQVVHYSFINPSIPKISDQETEYYLDSFINLKETILSNGNGEIAIADDSIVLENESEGYVFTGPLTLFPSTILVFELGCDGNTIIKNEKLSVSMEVSDKFSIGEEFIVLDQTNGHNFVNKINTVQLEIGKELYFNHKSMKYLWINLKKTGNSGKCMIRNLRFYDKLNEMKSQFSETNTNIQTEMKQYDSAQFEYKWTCDKENVLQGNLDSLEVSVNYKRINNTFFVPIEKTTIVNGTEIVEEELFDPKEFSVSLTITSKEDGKELMYKKFTLDYLLDFVSIDNDEANQEDEETWKKVVEGLIVTGIIVGSVVVGIIITIVVIVLLILVVTLLLKKLKDNKGYSNQNEFSTELNETEPRKVNDDEEEEEYQPKKFNHGGYSQMQQQKNDHYQRPQKNNARKQPRNNGYERNINRGPPPAPKRNQFVKPPQRTRGGFNNRRGGYNKPPAPRRQPMRTNNSRKPAPPPAPRRPQIPRRY